MSWRFLLYKANIWVMNMSLSCCLKMFTHTQVCRVILWYKNIYFNTDFQLSWQNSVKTLGKVEGVFVVCLVETVIQCFTVFEMAIVIALFGCSLPIMWRWCYFVLLTSSGIFSSHFHWHKSLFCMLFSLNFYTKNFMVQWLWPEDAEGNVTYNDYVVIYKKTQNAMLWFCLETAQWNVSVSSVILWNFHNVCACVCCCLPLESDLKQFSSH